MQMRAGTSWGGSRLLELSLVGIPAPSNSSSSRTQVSLGALSWGHRKQLLTPWLDTEGKSDQEEQGSWGLQIHHPCRSYWAPRARPHPLNLDLP